MKRLLIILFFAMTAVCANAQKELNVDSIIRVGIKKLFKPEVLKENRVIIFEDYNCFNYVKFDNEKTYCGLIRSSYFDNHYSFWDRIRDLFKYRPKTYVYVLFTYGANYFDVNICSSISVSRRVSFYSKRLQIRHIYSCETGKWELIPNATYEF